MKTNFTIENEKVLQPLDNNQGYVVEASTLGLAPGDFPLVVILNGKEYTMSGGINGEVWIYTNDETKQEIHILND